MPRMPKWMGDAVESLMASKFLTVTVTQVEYLSPEVKRVCFTGDLSRADFDAGYAVTFRVSALDHRDYTPVIFTKDTCEIIFHIHGNGPGSAFADGLQVGDTTKMVIPRGRKLYREGVENFFFGDESSIGTLKAIMQEVPCTGILELDEANFRVPEKLGMQVDVVRKGDNAFAVVKEKAAYVLTGNGESIQSFRKLLKERGVNSSQIITKAYWIPGKKGL
ncbi:siderophore-interacting protein [Chitinophaga niabensis]|uniref:NADPH-dependent ferric siderophore reductase, contains FAD-binding and SIP domains n=1 Tax=Chitinophaga niabensis TaxID=536979 RepID=A0A1N6IYC9_9BACT|nr:siderophore-interacting protein [Chitinophaga niabensis]SIO36987.1 NADPH-dependent ferric siderophore reductase, contains FAD-binding and SIP domains [Chitinophaga niabensis]